MSPSSPTPCRRLLQRSPGPMIALAVRRGCRGHPSERSSAFGLVDLSRFRSSEPSDRRAGSRCRRPPRPFRRTRACAAIICGMRRVPASAVIYLPPRAVTRRCSSSISDVIGRVLDHDKGAGLRLHRVRLPAEGNARGYRRRHSRGKARRADLGGQGRWSLRTARRRPLRSSGDDADRRQPRQRRSVVWLFGPLQPAACAPGAAVELGQAGNRTRHRPERG